ncbi:MAG TPA: ABC transporter ATP-binding protein [Desulfobacteraceae bacterium]|nr:MAG: branched-chain amino acid ABC transporter ATP-binding protein [Deltaproteobacteria bacterium]HDI58975.1 ABC transporter ATP-binding protein [Desulfobacteraceae bacterium]
MTVLQLASVSAGYGDTRVLWDVDLEVEKGRIVALLGANGAGKTTTLKTICGLLPATQGRLYYNGNEITGLPVHEMVNLGLALIPEGRQLFGKMTVEENLIIGSFLKRAKAKRAKNLAWVYELFPALANRKNQSAETLSGGEQQMVAIGRGLMQNPDLIMFDEPSLGLAPLLVQEMFRVIEELHRRGLTIFLVEQNVHQTLRIADFCYVIENGRIVQKGTGKELAANASIREAYLGI